MLLQILVLSSILQLIAIISGHEFSVIRHADGDIFTAEGSCHVACGELSSGTGTPYSRSITTTSPGIPISNGTCICQCEQALPVFREDLHICVNDIHECSVAGFSNNPGTVEKIPYVFLPQRGQIIYPQAEISFDGVITPVCGIAGAQQLGKVGWLELRNLSNAEPPFRLFRDEGRTFLQWIGESGLKEAAEGKVIVVRLVCKDAAVNSISPGVFIPCIAFRVAGSPSKSSVREVTFAVPTHNSQGLSILEYIAIGISSAVLAVIYVTSVFLYLNSRKSRCKPPAHPPLTTAIERDGAGLVNNAPLVDAASHIGGDTNRLNEDDLGQDFAESDGEQGFDNQVTSAIIHPYHVYMECPEGPFSTGSILGERIPEEDVRIVETLENTHQQDSPVLPGTQRRKLYFNPAYFERQLLLAPPPAAIDFLIKIREVISIAKHKMDAKRFVPTLTGIPEEENASEPCSSMMNKRVDSVQGSVTRSRKSQRCTGCPGCTGSSSKSMPALADAGRAMIDDSRVRAWLEDVKPPERRWKDPADSNFNIQDNSINHAGKFEYLEEMPKNDFLQSENAILTSKSPATWKDNLPMLRTFQNISRSEIFEEDDRNSACWRSTKSMFEESSWDRYYRAKNPGPSSIDILASESTINAKVRQAIEDSFMEQMEENAILENQSKRPSPKEDLFGKHVTNGTVEEENSQMVAPALKSLPIGRLTRSRKCRAPSTPTKDLPDMINELPADIPPKRIMDAVIREMVDAKAREHCSTITPGMAYEIDSLERTNRKLKRKTISPNAARQKNPKSTLTKPNYIENSIDRRIRESTNHEIDTRNVDSNSTVNEEVLRKNYYNMPELLSQRPEGYSLVSEVYVNDGYSSPAGSDDSGPEIRYEAENPGHLTIKVLDSPKNYIKQDESEYEPDTLDRKPMRLKINGDVIYDRDLSSESYVDSLERSSHIFLRSKCSFRDDGDLKNRGISLHRGYGSLREIYEARLRSNLKDSDLMSSTRSLNRDLDNTMSWKKNKYLTPNLRQAKRQRKPENQPDVVPAPLADEIYQQPKPLRRVEYADYNGEPDGSAESKNDWDRSHPEAGNPTASDGTPVLRNGQQHCVGNSSSQQLFGINEPPTPLNSKDAACSSKKSLSSDVTNPIPSKPHPYCCINPDSVWNVENEVKSGRHEPTNNSSQSCSSLSAADCTKLISEQIADGTRQNADIKNWNQIPFGDLKKCLPIAKSSKRINNPSALVKVEDSGYLSSTDSNGSHKHLLRYEFGSVSETDETESICDGASESGAESVGTDSVFYGNFSRLSEVSNFSKSVDSGLDVGTKNLCLKNFCSRTESLPIDRSSAQASDSECESFITVLPHNIDS